jgi:hypothetical protein
MPLSSIVVIVLRLFALNWLATAIPLFLSAATLTLPSERNLSVVLRYAPAALLLVAAAALWVLAAPIGRFVSRGVDTSVSIGSLSRADLYSFAFVFLGLFFVLSSFADVINWVHYFATVSPDGHRPDPRAHNLYQLTRPFVTLALGLLSLVGAPRWTKKLISRDQKA